MIDLKKNLEENKVLITLLSLISLFRIYLGMKMPLWLFQYSPYDDNLMFEYSHLNMHFHFWNIQSLSKDMSYPLFLFFVRLSHIPYRFWLSLLWIIAGILVIYAIYKYITKDKLILIGSFLFVLFLPMGFDVLCGQRVYRNGIMAPFAIIFLSTLYIFINKLLDSTSDIKNTVIWGILLGLTFTFNYYTKEDGILTLPILVVCVFSVLLFKLYGEIKLSYSKPDFKKLAKISLICIIPLIIFMAGTFTYQEVNNHYFGISEINTRTSGELGEFYGNLLKIEDPNKSTRIWIPASTVERAVHASPTLQSHPKFVNEWLDTKWGSTSIRNSTLPGDIPGWSIKLALERTGLYNNEKTASDFISKVNDELESAFDNGQLRKSDEIFITSSANGKNISEIMDLTPHVLSGMGITFFYQGFEFNKNLNHSLSSVVVSNNVTKNVSQDINDHLITQSELDHLSVFDSIPMKLIELDIGIYQVISYILFLLAFASFILICVNQLKDRFKNRNMNMLLLYCIMLIGTILVQVFAVTWFCSYLGTEPWVGTLDNITSHIKFYLTSSYGFFTVFVVFTIAEGYELLKNYKLDKNSINTGIKSPVSTLKQRKNMQTTKENIYKTQPQERKQQTTKENIYKTQPQERKQQTTKENIYKTQPQEPIDIDSIDSDLIEEILKEIKMERKNKD